MLSQLRQRLTFANVTSLLALFVALGGTSYAALTVSGRNIADGTVTGKDIKRKSVPLNRLRGALPVGPQGPQGEQGRQGEQGVQGLQGEPGSAVAYAYVQSSGAVDPARTKNVTAYWSSQGVYCVDATVPVKNVVANAATNSVFVSIFASTTGCPAGSDVTVDMRRHDNVLVDGDFWITFN